MPGMMRRLNRLRYGVGTKLASARRCTSAQTLNIVQIIWSEPMTHADRNLDIRRPPGSSAKAPNPNK
jgi:hypothetical protein